MKNETKEDIKAYTEFKKREFKKCIKRIFTVLCYGVAVFNIATPERLWSLPLIAFLYIIYSLLSYDIEKKICVSELVMSLIFKITLVYFISVFAFNMGLEYMPYVCLISWAAEGIIYRADFKGEFNIKKIFWLFLSTMLFIGGVSVGAVILPSSITMAMALGVFVSIGVLTFCIVPARAKLLFFLRKYFHIGIDVKDEY